jgi:hypothetical protein
MFLKEENITKISFVMNIPRKKYGRGMSGRPLLHTAAM